VTIIMTSLLKKLSISIKIHVVKPLFSFQIVDRPNPSAVVVSLVANCVHTANADATQLDSCLASEHVSDVISSYA